ncbi:DUF922 domain-containing protein [Mucilaginibacter myungsuensis]|uniref:DUF922 domain-containing protein n=1 Tax=Mucilaginibacter myungsuensis TaxID=649104 RepID=A0A929L3N4_9SPHI|nr:hypothetical protein [Mucilaginibacter myungsuensis]MBE9663884.1 hypothetical protein [Mucilaginibacter myungsuensis]MDN3598400.1 hypothetical protein [Mucilaginibacter myungsuensis]
MQFLNLTILFMLWVSPTVDDTRIVKWKEDRPLTWADFKGGPDYRAGAGSVIVWDTRYNYRVERRDTSYILTFTLDNVMYTDISWVMRDQMGDYLLGHEQTHFDINELFTRKLAAAFKDAVFTSNYKAEMDTIFRQNRADCGAMESKYDKETSHAGNHNMQYRWQLFVFLELQKLPKNY